jgi:hypothetical protein
MSHQEIQAVANMLAERAAIRAKAIDNWVSLAMEQSNPREWSNALLAAALERLEIVPESLPVKAEARLQLLDIQRAILARIGNHSTDDRRIA